MTICILLIAGQIFFAVRAAMRKRRAPVALAGSQMPTLSEVPDLE